MINNTKLETDIPKGYSIQEDGDTLVITKKLINYNSISILIFFSIWYFGLIWMNTTGGNLEKKEIFLLLLMLIIPSPLLYKVLVDCINRIVIKIDSSKIVIRNYPIPNLWGINQNIKLNSIKEIYNMKMFRRKNNYEPNQILADLIDNKQIKLLSNLNDQEVSFLTEILKTKTDLELKFRKKENTFINRLFHSEENLGKSNIHSETYKKKQISDSYKIYKVKNSGEPKGINIMYDKESLIISRKWFKLYILVILLIFLSIFDGFIYFIFLKNMTTSQDMLTKAFAYFFLFIVSSMTIFPIFYLLLNKTKIIINSLKITITHGPLPTFSNKEIASSEVKQIYFKESDQKALLNPDYYSVIAILKNGEKLKLLDESIHIEEATFLEQKIEEYLGIMNEKVEDKSS